MGKDEERRAARRKKKKELKEKQKRAEKINLKMIIPGDEGPTAAEDGLFQMSDLRDGNDLKKVGEDDAVNGMDDDSDSDDEDKPKPKHLKYDKENGTIDSEGLWYGEHDEKSDHSGSDEDSDNGENLGLEGDEEDSDDEADEKIKRQDETSKNPLIMSLSTEDSDAKKARKAESWFSKLGDIDEDSDLEEAEIERAVNIVQKKGGTIKKKEAVEKKKEKPKQVYNSDSEDDDDKDEDSDNEMTDSDEEEIEHKSAS